MYFITEMLVPGHVCALYVATGGANGPALGSDEKEIVLLDYSVIDVLTNEVRRFVSNRSKSIECTQHSTKTS